MKFTKIAAVSIFLGLSVGACSTKTVHIPGVGSIKYSNNGSNVTVYSNGNSFGEGTKIPSNFPSSVPLPTGYRVLSVMNGTNAATASSGATNAFDLYLAAKGTAASLASSYQSQLQSAGFTISNQGSMPNSSSIVVVSAKSGQWSVTALFGEAGSYQSELKAGEVSIDLTVANGS